MKKSKKKPTTFSRRQFIGSCAAGASLLQIAPYLALTGCSPVGKKYPPVSGREYHPMAFKEDELRKLEESTFPMLETDFSEGIKFKVIFPGFYSSKKFARVNTKIKKIKKIKKFRYISIDKTGWSNNSGRPEMPFFGFLVHIPEFLEYNWNKTILPEYGMQVYPRMVTYPSQVKYFDNIDNPINYGDFEYDRDYYKSDIEPDEDQVVQVSEPFYIGFSRFVLVKVNPLLYYPKKKCLYGYPGIEIDFEFIPKTQMRKEYYYETPFIPSNLEYIPKHERIIDPWCSSNPDGSRKIDLFNNIVEDFNFNIDRRYDKIKETHELLIIYGEDKDNKISLEAPATRLKNHKIKEMGIDTEMISYSSVLSSPGFQSLPQYIRDYRAPRTEDETVYFSKLKNVILLGDLDLIPCPPVERILFEEDDQDSHDQSRSRTEDNSGKQSIGKTFFSDYYCATHKNAEDRNEIILPDIAIGRIPVKDENEADTVVGNIIHYETNPYQVRQNLTFAGYFQDTGKDGYKCNGVASTNYIQTLEDIRQRLVPRDISVDTIYDIQDRNMIQEGLRYLDNTPVENADSMFTDILEQKDKILDSFGRGNRIIVHRDHGYMNGWSRPSFKIPDFWDLFNSGEKEIPSSIVFNMNCLSGHFIGEKTLKMPARYYDCFSEVLLKGPLLPDGIRRNLKCPAVVASVEESPTFHNDWFIKGIFDNIYGGILSLNNNIRTEKIKLGEVFNLSKILLFILMDDPCINMYENEIYHVLGDPTILI